MTKTIKTEELELNEAFQKVLYWFFAYPDSQFGLSELAEHLSISKKTANRVVVELCDEGFLEIEDLGRLWRIQCNKDHIYNYSRKISFNLSIIYESDMLDLIKQQIPNYVSITLFGTYRLGKDTDLSDVDVAVEVIGNKKMEVRKLADFQGFGYRTNKIPINLHIFSRTKVDKNVFASIANGIVLDGFLEVKP